MPHRPDPDEVPTTSPEVIAYNREVTRLGLAAPEPTARLAYGPDRGQRLDVYAPPGGVRDAPVLLFFHGGGWVSGHLGWLRFMAPHVTKLGFLFVAGSYRLAPRCRWPAQYEDVRDALWFVHRNTESWGGDPGRIAIAGHSAGGHLAALVALRNERPDLAICLPVSASMDLRYGDVPLESDAGRVYRYLFAHREQDRDASPIEYADGNRTPFHLSWGERDFDRVRTSSERMTDKLAAQGGPVSYRVLPGASHFDTHLALGRTDDPWYVHLARALQPTGVSA